MPTGVGVVDAMTIPNLVGLAGKCARAPVTRMSDI
jgi:hypothetical protein